MDKLEEYRDRPCPICGKVRKMTAPRSWWTLKPSEDKVLEPVGAPLYQVSYPGSPEHIPPRCSNCLDRAQRPCPTPVHRDTPPPVA